MIKVALVPAGGLGFALQPITRAIPKELFPFAGKPVIEHVIDNIKQCGIENIVFIAGHKKSALLDYIGDGSLFDINASFIFQEIPSGPGDAILCGSERVLRDKTNENFLVCFGDNIISPFKQIQETMKIHEINNPLATVLIFPTSYPTRYGIVEVKKEGNIEKIVNIVEKPKSKNEQNRFKNETGEFSALSSIMVLNIKVFDYLKKIDRDIDNRLQIADALQKAINDGEKIIAHRLKGKFIDVSNWDFLWDLRNFFKNLSDSDLKQIIAERNNKMKELGDDI